MAGGDIAIRKSVENAEDSPSRAEEDLASLDPPLSRLDSLIGIATSGRTPYVLGGLSHAKSLGVLTIGICCVKPSEMEGKCDHLIECVVGSEVVTGSTRLKAGTATKLVRSSTGRPVLVSGTNDQRDLEHVIYGRDDTNWQDLRKFGDNSKYLSHLNQ